METNISIFEQYKKNHEKDLISEIKKQYENIYLQMMNNSNINIKVEEEQLNTDIQWLIACYRVAFYNHLDLKSSRKKYLLLLHRSIVIPLDEFRLKYPIVETESNNKSNLDIQKRHSMKLWEYKLQILTRLEYMNLYSDLVNSNSEKVEEDTVEQLFQNNIDMIVQLLQDISFLLDTSVSGGLIMFLENIVIPRYIENLKKVLCKIYKQLEISKPISLKTNKDGSVTYKTKEDKLNEFIKQHNILDGGDTSTTSPTTTTKSIDNILSVEIDTVHQQSKKLKLEMEQKYKPNSNNNSDNCNNTKQQQPQIPNELSNLLKKVSAKKLSHFSMSLANPRNFRTHTTTTQNN
ncbi:hypothetical protein DLAC_01004 [Tieghemostelium lacteum]|uniref:Uncharacterized protein n=1 Tax=Tieghemostelium lacteum TaxID=361077 RepID=A0A152A7K1_TIELA|nr:hypothetical protein DLAC_01004 [Tieghemostelium lacteum]|eukprot:KYR02188.1 hypothetical protein DLAC_01004 [Tieghemostelium lacteum]